MVEAEDYKASQLSASMPPVVGSKVRFTSGDRPGEWKVIAVKNSNVDVRAADGEVLHGIPFYMLEQQQVLSW
jgi:hypothetical protein